MSASIRTALWSATVIAVLGSCVEAARAAPIDDCSRARGTSALQPCTQVIEDEKEKTATRAYARLLRARAELDMSDLDRADADIAAALAQAPNNTFAYRLRARLRSLQGKENEARADLTKAVQMPQSEASKYVSYLDRGNFYVRNMELPPALADFQAAIRIDPTKAAAYVGRAVAAKAGGNISDALADLDRAKAVEPGYKQTFLERGDILVAEKRFAEAIADFNAALALDAKDARALRGRTAATALLGAGGTSLPPFVSAPVAPPAAPPAPKIAAPSVAPSVGPSATPSTTPNPAPGVTPSAIPAAPPAAAPSTAAPAPSAPVPAPAPPATATPAQPSAPAPVPPSKTADAPDAAAPAAEVRRGKLKEALTLRQSGKHKEALAIYDELLRGAPADLELAVEKGRTFVALERWKEALDILKPIVESKTAPAGIKAFAFEAQGEVLARNNQFEAAILSNTAALAINPKLLGALFWRGLSSFSIGAFDTALTDFQQAGAIVPTSPLYPGWEALALVGIGDLAKAKEAVDRGLAIQQDNTFALTARARLRLAAGQLDDAEADLASLARRGPLSGVALQTQQLIMIHKVFKPSDPPASAKP